MGNTSETNSLTQVDMKYSVIVPYWNSEKWIERCCNSLHEATGDFEFLLVNDGSTDNGPDIVARFAKEDARFNALENKRAKGVSGARNTGIDNATAEWITFLDADDELLPDAHIVFERMSRLDDTSNIIQANYLRHYDAKNRTALKYTNRKGIYTLSNPPLCWCMVWNKLYRRSFIGDTRFIEGQQYGEDEMFILHLFEKDERIFHTQTKTVTIMRHFDNKESLSRTKGKDGLLKQARGLEDFIKTTENARVRTFAMQTLSEHWSSPTFLKAFGGAKL